MTQQLEKVSVEVLAGSGASTRGELPVQHWSAAERKSRALKKTGRIVGTVFLVAPVGLFIHFLILIILPTLVLTLIAAFPLYLRFYGDDATFASVEAACPWCGKENVLRPYLSPRYAPTVTAVCSSCGQTAQVHTLSAAAEA